MTTVTSYLLQNVVFMYVAYMVKYPKLEFKMIIYQRCWQPLDKYAAQKDGSFQKFSLKCNKLCIVSDEWTLSIVCREAGETQLVAVLPGYDCDLQRLDDNECRAVLHLQ